MAKTPSSLIKRWLTGIVLVPLLLLVIFFGSEAMFAAVVILFICGGVWEYHHMVFGQGFVMEKIESLAFAVIIPLCVLSGNHQYLTALLALAVMMVFVLFIGSIRESSFDFLSVAKVVFGIMYIPFLMSHFIAIRMLDRGIWWIVFVLVLAFAGDTVALYTGKYFGKHKLVPLISPGKTVEGLIGLVAGSTVACMIYSYYLLPDVAVAHVAAMAFVGGMIGQLGDICESAIKRGYGLKDAGSILPGHGGILDRLDCLMFIAPFVYYYKIFVIG